MKSPILSLLVILLLVAPVGCGKYEDGPAISLRSRTKRLVGQWQMENADIDGTSVGGFYSTFNVGINEDGSYTESIGVLGFPAQERNGTWGFNSSYEAIQINYDDLSSSTVQITRLAYNELWVEFPTFSFTDGSEVIASIRFRRND